MDADCVAADPEYQLVPEVKHLEAAEAVLYFMGHHASRLRLGRAIVHHSLPNELVRLILRPTWIQKDVRKTGVGVSRKFTVPPIIKRWMGRYMAKILSTRLTPLLFHLAKAFTVDKK